MRRVGLLDYNCSVRPKPLESAVPDGKALIEHEDRFFDPDPATRRAGRDIYESTRDLPLLCTHGHVDPAILANNAPFPEPTATAPATSVGYALSRLRRIRLVPVIVIDDPENAVPLARALEAGGLPVAEITFRTPRAGEALRRIRDECPDILRGAGTVLTAAQAAEARDAGAQFIVSPGFGPAVVDYCLDHDLAVFPGIATCTELEAALSKGLKVVKFFPAETLGGIAYLKMMSAPYGSDVGFMPSGGISLSNIGDYLSFPRVVSCGGSWIAPADVIAARQFDRIQSEAAQAVATVSRFPAPPTA